MWLYTVPGIATASLGIEIAWESIASDSGVVSFVTYHSDGSDDVLWCPMPMCNLKRVHYERPRLQPGSTFKWSRLWQWPNARGLVYVQYACVCVRMTYVGIYACMHACMLTTSKFQFNFDTDSMIFVRSTLIMYFVIFERLFSFKRFNQWTQGLSQAAPSLSSPASKREAEA